MDKREFYQEVYESLSSDEGGFETDNACLNRLVCLFEDIAFSLRDIREELNHIDYRLAGG